MYNLIFNNIKLKREKIFITTVKILSKLFGDNLSDKLLSNQISDELLDSVQNAIFEIEKISWRN